MDDDCFIGGCLSVKQCVAFFIEISIQFSMALFVLYASLMLPPVTGATAQIVGELGAEPRRQNG